MTVVGDGEPRETGKSAPRGHLAAAGLRRRGGEEACRGGLPGAVRAFRPADEDGRRRAGAAVAEEERSSAGMAATEA